MAREGRVDEPLQNSGLLLLMFVVISMLDDSSFCSPRWKSSALSFVAFLFRMSISYDQGKLLQYCLL